MRLNYFTHLVILAVTFAAAASDVPLEALVMLATPCYGGLVHDSFYLSVMRAMQYYRNSGIILHASTVPGIADLPKARGALIYKFLAEQSYTHILFVDADIEFGPEYIERAVRSGKDVACVMYPKKAIEWDGIQRAARAGGTYVTHLPTLKAMGLNYPVEWLFESSTGSEEGSVPTDENGWAEVKRAGAGFMMVTRTAILALRDAYPELAYVDIRSQQTHYAFFLTVLGKSPVTGETHWISEDFAFCDRWSALGGKIWVDMLNGLNHTGSIKYEGNEWLLRYLPSSNM
mmetsp:Transcript_7338/g.13805  ORF Transcript_7338/g.13805 Transcript_7338/m.13805 type:complete len:288 (+) Transcript_7338:41-904(+)